MAATTINNYGVELSQGPPGNTPTYAPLRPNQKDGRLRVQMFTYKGVSDASGQNIALLKIPKGARLLDLCLAVSSTLGSATLAFGLAGANGNGYIDDANVPQYQATGIYGSDTSGAQVADGVALVSAAATYTSANSLIHLLGATAQNYMVAPAAEGVLNISTGPWLYMVAKDVYLTMTVGTASLGTQVIQGYLIYIID